MQLFHRDRKSSSNPKRWSLFIEKPNHPSYQQFQDPVFLASLQTSDNCYNTAKSNRISVLSTISAPAVPRTKQSSTASKGKSKAKSISKRLSLKLGMSSQAWWKSSSSQQVPQEGVTPTTGDFYNPDIETDSFEDLEDIFPLPSSASHTVRKRSSQLYQQQNSSLLSKAHKRHSIGGPPTGYNYNEMAASKRRESTMAEFLMMVDPHEPRSRLSSPTPNFRQQDLSIDNFLQEFSPDDFEIPPETDGKRPVSPEGKTRSRPLTPSLDDSFDFRSLNITPEPVLGRPNGSSFQVDSPPPYNSWTTEESEKKDTGVDTAGSASQSLAESSPQRGSLPWYSDVSGNRSSFHSLDELQPPSYPSAVETPERYTWAGDGKDENIWKRFVGNPEDREAVEILKQAEVEAFRSSSSRRRDGVIISGRRRDSSGEDEPEFVRPRRDTGAWWLGGSSDNTSQNDGNGSDTTSGDDESRKDPHAVTSSATEGHTGGVGTSVDNALISAVLDDEALSFQEMLEDDTTIFTSHDAPGTEFSMNNTTPMQTSDLDSVGICGICGADLHYHNGEASEDWYMTMKTHFEVAHGSWAARMPTWFGTSSTGTEQTEVAEPLRMDLDPIPESALEDPTDDMNFKSPEPERIPDTEPDDVFECPIPTCTESFEVFRDLNIHIFERHGMRGTPLGFASSKVSAGGKARGLGPDGNLLRGFECPTFGCNARFVTSEDREMHTEQCHQVKPRPSIAEEDSMNLDDLFIEEPVTDGKAELDEFFMYRCKGSSQAVPHPLVLGDEAKVSEFKQLLQGFATSLKMNDDIQSENSGRLAHGNLDVFSASSTATQSQQLEGGKNVGQQGDLMFNQTLSELLKVVRQTCDSGSSVSQGAFDVKEWLQNYLDLLPSDVAEVLVSSSPSYYENISTDPEAAEWVQRIRSELSKMRPKSSRKGKEKATEYRSQLPVRGLTATNPKHLESRDAQAEEVSRVKLASMNTRFLTAADKAYEKLLAGTLRPNASKEFRDFVADLGSVSDIIDLGVAVTDMILDQDVPRCLKKVYCFLHVAYAISQSESITPEKSNILEFQAGLSMFRHCLPAISEIPGMPSERDIFDEIAFVMWEELEYALKWIETWDGHEVLNKAGCSANEVSGLKAFMRNHCETGEQVGGGGMTIDPKLLSLEPGMDSKVQQEEPVKVRPVTWEDILGSGVFSIIIRWLKELSDTGVIFAYICGGICSTFASGFKKRIKFKDRVTAIPDPASQLEKHIQHDVVAPLNSYKYSGVGNVTSSAVALLKQGYISTIREFENRMVDLARVRQRTQEEFSAFVYAIIWHCNSCATFIPDSLWDTCKGLDDASYSLEYVDQRVHRELTWFTGGKPEDRSMTVGHMSLPENAILPIREFGDVAMMEDIGHSVIDPTLVAPTPPKIAQEDSPYSTASSGSPNNDSVWENSPRGHPGSETSISLPNSTNVSPDEIYVGRNMPNAGSFGMDYFSYPRPQVPATPAAIEQPVVETREDKPSRSKKRKYLEGDGATSFPARRRKTVPTTGKRLYCDVPGCEEFASTSSNLSRHKRTKHGNAAVREASYHCEHKGCDRVFYGPRGKGNLRTHMRKDHKC